MLVVIDVLHYLIQIILHVELLLIGIVMVIEKMLLYYLKDMILMAFILINQLQSHIHILWAAAYPGH